MGREREIGQMNPRYFQLIRRLAVGGNTHRASVHHCLGASVNGWSTDRLSFTHGFRMCLNEQKT